MNKTQTGDEDTRRDSLEMKKQLTDSLGSPLRNSAQMEASASSFDNHMTLEMEKQKMAQTFQAIGSKDKFLP